MTFLFSLRSCIFCLLRFALAVERCILSITSCKATTISCDILEKPIISSKLVVMEFTALRVAFLISRLRFKRAKKPIFWLLMFCMTILLKLSEFLTTPIAF